MIRIQPICSYKRSVIHLGITRGIVNAVTDNKLSLQRHAVRFDLPSVLAGASSKMRAGFCRRMAIRMTGTRSSSGMLTQPSPSASTRARASGTPPTDLP